MKKTMLLTAIISVVLLFASCGSKPYREYKKQLKTLTKEVEEADNLSELEKIEKKYCGLDDWLDDRLEDVSDSEIDELSELDKEFENMLDAKIMKFEDEE
ncbi:MAG: hypothetical protein KBT45_02730 [Bacteroidales bacterium]|nr:hypothetical protein [Candidatus Colimorpha pelethequi]